MSNNILKKAGIGASLMIGFLTGLKAADQPKIFVVDMAEVYDKFYKTEPAQKNFQILANQAKTEFDKKVQEGRKFFDERQALVSKYENPTLSEAAKKDLEKQIDALDERINQKTEEINRFRMEQDEKLNQQRQAMLAEHLKEINTDIETLAKSKNVDIILNKGNGGVLYAKEEFELTKEVIELVNKPAAKSGKHEVKSAASAAKPVSVPQAIPAP